MVAFIFGMVFSFLAGCGRRFWSKSTHLATAHADRWRWHWLTGAQCARMPFARLSRVSPSIIKILKRGKFYIWQRRPFACIKCAQHFYVNILLIAVLGNKAVFIFLFFTIMPNLEYQSHRLRTYTVSVLAAIIRSTSQRDVGFETWKSSLASGQ